MNQLNDVIEASSQIHQQLLEMGQVAANSASVSLFMFGLAIFILSCFVGYFVVWKVTPALHTPLMAVTNAISGVIIIGAMISLGSADEFSMIAVLSFISIVIASINIFGGFLVTWRMLEMFKR